MQVILRSDIFVGEGKAGYLIRRGNPGQVIEFPDQFAKDLPKDAKIVGTVPTASAMAHVPGLGEAVLDHISNHEAAALEGRSVDDALARAAKFQEDLKAEATAKKGKK